jgi:membrane-associated protein
VVAGVGEMGYRRFATYNVLGAILWVTSMTLAGYLLGNLVPNIEERIHIVVAVVIAVSLLPPAIAWLRSRRSGSLAR